MSASTRIRAANRRRRGSISGTFVWAASTCRRANAPLLCRSGRLSHAETTRAGGAAPPTGRPGEALPERYGLIVHGAAWQTKLWPEERWRTSSIVSPRPAAPWCCRGERRRAAACRRLAAGDLRRPALVAQARRAEVAELVAGADFAVGIDTGFMHLAAAFGVPGVTLFGPTDADYAMPYGAHQRAVRSDHPTRPASRWLHAPAARPMLHARGRHGRSLDSRLDDAVGAGAG